MEKREYDFYRNKPVKEFNINQTMYSMIKEANAGKDKLDAIEYFGSKINYGQLFSRADRLADAYYNAGIREGDTVGIVTINLPAVQENILALSKLGAKSKWIDLRIKDRDLIGKLNEKDNECKYVVVFDGAAQDVINVLPETDVEKVLVVSPKDYLNPIIKILATLKEKKEGTEPIRIDYNDRVVKYKDFLLSGDPHSTLEPVAFEKERPSLIIQSSGSTGKSKSILHTEYNLNKAMQRESYTDLPFADGKRMHISVPPFIIYGLCNSTYAALAFSMTGVMTPYVRAEAVYDDLGKFDFACGAPFHFRYIYDRIILLQNEIDELMKSNEKADKKELKAKLRELTILLNKLDKVSAFICGGDKIAPKELLTLEHTFNKPIINGYGNNEMCGAAIITPMYGIKPDSTGVPMKGIEVKAFDPETGEELPIDAQGEICMCSDNMFVEYINNEEETKIIKKMHKDGKEWIHTGDLGYIDKDGYVYITGRLKRLIKMDGFKIAPETIESVVLNLSEVKDCIVVGVPDAQHVEVPMIFLEKQSESSLSDDEFKQLVIDQCKQFVPDYEIPSYFEIIDEMPYKNGKHDFGKIEQLGKDYVEKLNSDIKKKVLN